MTKKLKNQSKINSDLAEAVNHYKRVKFDESRELLSAVLEEDPINPEAHYYMGLIYSKEENWKKAIVHLKSIVDIGINFIFTSQCRMILGLIYFKNNEFDRAENEFLEALKIDEANIKINAALSCVYHYMNERDKALKFAKKAYENDPYNLNAKNTYGFLLSDYDINVTKSIEMLREVVRIKPDNPAYLDSLGWAYFKKGDHKAAMSSLEEALKYTKNKEIKHHLDKVYRSLKSTR